MSDLKPHEKLIVGYLIKNKRIVSKDEVVLTGLSAAQVRRMGRWRQPRRQASPRMARRNTSRPILFLSGM
jgi:hypothetical protein